MAEHLYISNILAKYVLSGIEFLHLAKDHE